MPRNHHVALVGSVCLLIFSVSGIAAAENAAQIDRRGVIVVDRSARPTAQTRGNAVQPLSTVDVVELAALDLDEVAAQDELARQQGLPPRYAIPNSVSITPTTAGTWEQVDHQTMMWRLRITASNAVSVNLGFTRFSMPPGGRLFFYAADFSHVLRPFTDADNEDHGQLWTPPVLAADVVVEVTVPTALQNQLELELGAINQGYRGFGAGRMLVGSCNVDVICPEGDGWREQISTVGVISTGGGTFCTGFMVNNTADDLKPYFMTANHCGISSGAAPSLVVYWNYENSWCRPVGSPASGSPGDGPMNQFQTGSIHRASYSPSDVTLVELDDMPDPAWNVGYGGWDRSSSDSPTAVAIHHPDTYEKRISFENDPTSTTSYLGTSSPGDGTHVRVTDWDLGTTEPGSSGSPLFDQNQRVVGQLHGGYAACGNDDADWYGRFSVSWDGGGSPSSRLKDWLDTGNTGAVAVDFLSEATQCSDAGEISLDRAKYACEGVVLIRVVDCGLNLDDNAVETVTITIGSDSEPAGETVLLTETSDKSGKFEGTITVTGVDSPGRLLIAPGDTLTATYVDEDDGAGGTNITVMAYATIDCTAPVISDVTAINIEAGSATIRFRTDELAVGTVHYGTACGSLSYTTSGTEYGTVVDVDVSDGISFSTTYFYTVEAADEAGNSSSDNNGGSCYTFTTPVVPNFFTEQFGSDNDLDNHTILFTPNGSNDYYGACAEAISQLPTDPTGGTVVSLSDDDYQAVTVSGGEQVSLYGTDYTSYYIGSNGYITFTSGDDDYDETLDEHFGPPPRISALYNDFNPSQGGQVSWRQLDDHVAVTWLNVPEYSTGNSNTFQVQMFFDGRIHLNYLAVAAPGGIVGLSKGVGMSPDFYEVDLSAAGMCGINPPAEPAAPHNARKNRYVSIDPNNGSTTLAIELELTSMKRCSGDLARSCVTDADCVDPEPDAGSCIEHPSVGYAGWLSEPFDPTCQTGPGAPPSGVCRGRDYLSRIVDAPVYRAWTETPLHIGDCAILPVATYAIRTTTDEVVFSDVLEVGTIHKPGIRHYGDTVGESTGDEYTPPQGVVNVADVQVFLLTLQHEPGTPHATWVDLHGIGVGNPPNLLLNVSDLQRILFGFDGQTYTDSPEHRDPADCP